MKYIPPLVNKYQYAKFKQINESSGRKYEYDGVTSPSVTTILSATADKTFLVNWKNRIGHAKANDIVALAAGRGTVMHNCLENRMAGLPDLDGDLPIRIMGRKMADVMQDNAWPNISEVWGMEVSLCCTGLWAGSTDLVGIHSGSPAIIDYKNARKPKRREYIGDYILQGTAYALAHNEMFGTNIRKVVICICVYDDDTNTVTYQEFIVENEEFDTAVVEWIARVEQYYNLGKC